VPGTHEASGPLAGVAGLRIEDDAGRAVGWKRDEVEPFRVVADVPAGAGRVTVRLDTICDRPAVHASGHLSYGNRSVGVVNWNTCLLYPEGPAASETTVRLRLRLPDGWKHASALRAEETDGAALGFAPVSLEELVDSPLIAGEYLKTVDLDAGPNPKAFFHVAADAPELLGFDAEVTRLYSRVVREAGALFGASHYPEYHFLVTCSDDLGHLGLEHHDCSLNGLTARDLLDGKYRRGWVANLLPHEYAHSWCGKYRRPTGMCATDFHTPERTSLLWVYEGLGEYLGELLMVRSGLVKPDVYREMLAWTVSDLLRREGRRWRPLDDTAAAAGMLRGASAHWNDLRRGQDFYFEGMLLWLEADALIRDLSGGERSLDDFCHRFFGALDRPGKVVPYDRDEVVRTLNAVAEYDWAAFLDRRVSSPLEALPLDALARCGYRVGYAAKPSAYAESQVPGGGALSARDSLGARFTADGRVAAVHPNTPADRAGLLPRAQVLAVNGWKFSAKRLQQALEASPSSRSVNMIIAEGDRVRTLSLDYADGPRYLELVRDPSRPDRLEEILRPRVGGAE
jgi:predicted metalloprotease with PDZ domain